jgi:hypothetical protein
MPVFVKVLSNSPPKEKPLKVPLITVASITDLRELSGECVGSRVLFVRRVPEVHLLTSHVSDESSDIVESVEMRFEIACVQSSDPLVVDVGHCP